MLPSSTQNPNSLKNSELGKNSNKNSNGKKSSGNKLATMDKKKLRLLMVGDKNPFKDIKHFSGVCTPARPYQKHEIEILKNYISVHDPQLWLFIQFIIYCLIRPNSELRLLQIHHIDFENSIILIPADIAKNKKSQWVTIPKVLMAQIQFLKQYPPQYRRHQMRCWPLLPVFQSVRG